MRTWKKALSLLLTLSMLLSLCVVGASAEELADEPASEPTIQTVEPTDVDGVDAQDVTYVAAIGNTQYETLAAAVTAAMSGDTIELLTDCEGSGIFLAAGDKTLSIDFGGHTYTVNSLVGSSGTENQAFHLEKGNHVTLKNGEIKVAESAANSVKMLIQNYCDLNADGITLDGSTYSSMEYVFSNNDGNITINNCTITAPENCVAVDAAIWGSYAGASVAIENSTIIGDLEVAQWSSVGGWHKVDGFSATPDGRPILKVNSGSFTDLADAVLCAQDNATINLAEDITLTDTLAVSDGQTLTLDLNSKKITNEGGFGIVNNGKLTITGNGTIEAKYPVRNNADGSELVIENGTYISVEGAVTVRTTNSKVTINDGTFSASDNAVISSNGTAGLKGNTITINGGTFNGGITTSGYIACGIYAPNDDAVTVNDGTFNIKGGAGIVARAGIVTVNGGTFNTTGTGTGKVGDSRVGVPCSALVFDSDANYPGKTSDSKISVTGGTYSTDPGAYVAGGYAAALESDKYVVKGVQAAYTPHVDLSQSGGVKLTDSTFSGSVDTRTFTVTDSTIHTLYESILTGENPWKVANGKELTFATIKFGGLADESYYTVQQINPALAYAYSTTDFPDSTKTATYLGSDLKDGLCFPVSSQEGTITFKIAKASGASVTADLTNAAVYTYTNNIAFTASDAPAETAPVIEVAPTVSGTTASATVAAETIASTVESANTETKVEITATTTNTNVNEAKVELPKEAVAALVDTTAPEAPAAKVAAVEVKTDVGTVTLSSSALETIATDSTVQSNGATVEVKQASAPAGAIAALEVTVKSNSSEVAIANLEQPITISFNIGTGKVNPVLLYSNDGVLKNIKSSSYDPETGIITGTTNHLTTFVAVDPMTTVPGGIGQKVTLTPNTTGHYLTIQVTYGNANSIYTVQANAAVEIYVANGTVLNVWETTAVPTFDAGSFAPNSNPTILVNSATISAS